MKKRFVFFIASFILISALLKSEDSFAQKTGDILRVENGMMIVKFDKGNPDQCRDLLYYFSLNEDSLFRLKNIGSLTKDGWKVYHVDNVIAEIAKPLNDESANIQWGKQPIYFDKHTPLPGSPGYPLPVKYGVNSFKSFPNVYENKNDETVFYLKGNLKATKVFLAGNFNNWSVSSLPMKKTDSGWVAIQKLKPGKYLYKFIADGEWVNDANNNLRERDGFGNYNSAYLHHNYTFKLLGYTNAKKVIVAGNFNNWNEKELVMKRAKDGWYLNLYMSEGTHAYKFIVDGSWMLDPANKVTHPDGKGNVNSYLSLGDTSIFKLSGFTNAKNVFLVGNFNAWNPEELNMSRTSTGWQIPYVVPNGNYEYKFIVDGKWMTDPACPFYSGSGEEKNSLRAINSNHTFKLSKYPNAKEVYISGSFNSWIKPGYAMTKKDGVWYIPLYLPAGKYTYKFVVDGNWINDPGNPNLEENEYNTGNSVLWVQPDAEFLLK